VPGRISAIVLALVTAFAHGFWSIDDAAAAPPLLGDNAIEGTPDPSPVGLAEANRFVASATASAASLQIYVDETNAATAIVLGIYSDRAGVPDALLARGSISTVRNSAWNSVLIPATPLVAGDAYWIARLSIAGGDLVTRVDPGVPDPDRGDTRWNTDLPTTFSAGGSWPHRTSMYATAAGSPTPTPSPSPTTAPTSTPPATTTPPPPPPSTSAPAGFVGDNAIEPTADPSGVGVAEANRFSATTTGPVGSISIYLDAANRSTSFALGIYADASGVPGALLTQGRSTTVQNGAWNSVSIPAYSLSAGTPYWLARLSLAGGDLVTRVNPSQPNPDRADTRANLTLPATFSPGGSFPHRTSMYADGAGAATPAPSASPTPTSTATPVPTPTATPTTTPTPSGSFACTQTIGYSQTMSWYSDGNGFQASAVDNTRHQILWQNGGAVHYWADPNDSIWSNSFLDFRCASSSTAPDRIVMDVTEDFYLDDPANGGVTRVAQDIRNVIATLRSKYPSVRQIYLQPVVGGPDGSTCTVGGVRVRASVNHPYIDQAIRDVIAGQPGFDVRAGPVTRVASCSDYADSTGHLNSTGAVGRAIGDWYAVNAAP
jgi:hypothetical protein